MLLTSWILVTSLGLGLLLGAHCQAEEKTPNFRGVPTQAWLDRLKDPSAAVRRETVSTLANDEKGDVVTDEAAEVMLPALLKLIQDSDREIRRHSSLAWVKFHEYRPIKGPEAKLVLPVLIDAAQDREPRIRMLAAAGMVRVNREEKAVLGPLTQLMKDPDEGVRSWTCTALGNVTPPTAPSLCSSAL